jgi:acetyl-CoA carboxylase biotin carboxyl carrier protein
MAEIKVKAEITGRVWKIIVTAGTRVAEDEPIVMIESMKMEIPVVAPSAGVVKSLLVNEGDDVSEGQDVAVMET